MGDGGDYLQQVAAVIHPIWTIYSELIVERYGLRIGKGSA
jgi:hypothetical protein